MHNKSNKNCICCFCEKDCQGGKAKVIRVFVGGSNFFDFCLECFTNAGGYSVVQEAHTKRVIHSRGRLDSVWELYEIRQKAWEDLTGKDWEYRFPSR